MLNIKFTLSGGGGLGRDIWHMTESRCIHSQELLLLALLLVLLAMDILNNLPGLTSCHCDNIGLVSLILLGWELRVLYHCTMCTRHPDLVSLDFYDIPVIQEVIIKRLTNKLYAYALAWKKTCLHANFRFIGAMVSRGGWT